MPKKDPSQEALDALRALEQDEPTEAGIDHLRKLLEHRSNHVVGRAARLGGAWKAGRLVPDLLRGFDYFLKDPVKRDPGCVAKRAIIEALVVLEHREPEVYLSGVRHVQPEPVFGGSEDTAAVLRGVCGEGLLECRYTDKYLVLADLVMDVDPRTRRVAVESLGRTDTPEAELLLRMVVLADRLGDGGAPGRLRRPDEEDADIIASALQGLMAIAPDRSLEFVASFLRSDKDTVAEGAALAIGEARLPASFSILRRAYEAPGGPDLLLFLLPMALTRDEQAIEFLLRVVEDEATPYAAAAVEALAIYRGDPACRTRIAEVVANRDGRQVTQAFRATFEE